MAENRTTENKVTELAENVQVLSELGFIGESSEAKEFREAWNSLDESSKVFYRGWIQGSLSAMAYMSGK